MFLAIWECGGSDDSLSRGFEHVVFGTHRAWPLRKVPLAKAEEAARVGIDCDPDAKQGNLDVLVFGGIGFRYHEH